MSAGVEFVTVGLALIVLGCVILITTFGKRRRLFWKYMATTGAIVLFVGGFISIYAGLGVSREMSLQASEDRLACLFGALSSYRREHGAFPQHLGELVDGRWIPPTGLHSIFQTDRSKTDCDYVYVQGLRYDDPGSWPIVFDIPGFHKDGTRSVILLSGDVLTCSREDFEELIERFHKEFQQKRGKESTLVYECPVTQ